MSEPKILYEAVVNGNKEKIIEILTSEDVTVLKPTGDDGDTLLHLAFRNSECNQVELIEILDILLSRGMDINAKNNSGKTILHLAVERRMRDVIDFCLRRNADPHLKHRLGNTIAHFAVEEEHRKLQLFIKENYTTENLELMEKESSSFIDWMASKGFDFFHRKNKNDHTALYLANALNLQHIILTLLNRVSDLTSAEVGQTPLLCAFLDISANPYKCLFVYHHKKIPTSIHSDIYASRYGHNIVKMILEKSKFIDDRTLTAALHLAIASEYEMSVIEVLLQRITDVNLHKGFIFFNGKSVLETLAGKLHKWSSRSKMKNYIKILRVLIGKGANVHKRDGNDVTVARKLFCRCPKLEMLELLKENEADFDKDFGESILHLVCEYGNEAGMVDYVLNDSCDVNAKNYRDETPLQLAITCKNDIVAGDLIDHGAKVNIVYKGGKTPLSMACATGQADVAEKLINFGANLGFKDNFDRTLLHLATNNSKVVELLVKSKADVNAKDYFGKTPLHYAMTSPVMKVLFNAGAQVNALDKENHSPLYDSLSRKKTTTMAELLKCAADVRDLKVVELLRKHCQNCTATEYPKFKYFKEHMVKMVAVGLLDKVPFAPNGLEEAMQKFYEQCLAEVEILKTFFVDDCTSLYQLLHKNRNRRCAYIDNEKLKALVTDSRKFPIYSVLIVGCYNEAIRRKPLLESAINVLNEFTETVLPDLCSDKIFAYLSNMNLVCFVEACGDLRLNKLSRSVTKMHLSGT